MHILICHPVYIVYIMLQIEIFNKNLNCVTKQTMHMLHMFNKRLQCYAKININMRYPWYAIFESCKLWAIIFCWVFSLGVFFVFSSYKTYTEQQWFVEDLKICVSILIGFTWLQMCLPVFFFSVMQIFKQVLFEYPFLYSICCNVCFG